MLTDEEMSIWKWYCSKLLPIANSKYKLLSERANKCMSQVISASDEMFIFLELKQFGFKWCLEKCGEDKMINYNKFLIEELKKCTPNHKLIDHLFPKKLEIEDQETSSDPIQELCAEKDAEQIMSQENDNSVDSETDECNLKKQESFWDNDNDFLDKYTELIASPVLKGKTKAHSYQKMDEFVICTHLILCIRSSPHCKLLEEDFKAKMQVENICDEKRKQEDLALKLRQKTKRRRTSKGDLRVLVDR